ncbi:L1P family of ribosomal protein [Besnoitia besnoiti]|uniref:L1P family of ribosomal protein n=1 Tax=Besnoitia besnoiti TaxID=94643 RepID=A0A2A9MAE2_BESBE|nr:L1P family of ribosomal protein [Besnoitia besnoiti]PFH32906.1 L1P family of ribosomal protein [Besnoitia besnoiti]
MERMARRRPPAGRICFAFLSISLLTTECGPSFLPALQLAAGLSAPWSAELRRGWSVRTPDNPTALFSSPFFALATPRQTSLLRLASSLVSPLSALSSPPAPRSHGSPSCSSAASWLPLSPSPSRTPGMTGARRTRCVQTAHANHSQESARYVRRRFFACVASIHSATHATRQIRTLHATPRRTAHRRCTYTGGLSDVDTQAEERAFGAFLVSRAMHALPVSRSKPGSKRVAVPCRSAARCSLRLPSPREEVFSAAPQLRRAEQLGFMVVLLPSKAASLSVAFSSFFSSHGLGHSAAISSRTPEARRTLLLSAAVPPSSAPESASAAASPAPSSASVSPASPGLGQAPASPRRLNIGERRRLDRMQNWFKQYPYAPEPPVPPKQKSTMKINVDPDNISPDRLPLPSRRLPSSLRWKALAGTAAPAPVTLAAAGAAVEAAHEAVRTLQAGGMPRRRKGKNRKMKKVALARAAVAAAVAAQKAPGLAALKAAAASAERLVSSPLSTESLASAGNSVSEDGIPDPVAVGAADAAALLPSSPSSSSAAERETGGSGASAEGQRSSLLSVLYPSRDAAYPPDLAVFLVKQLSTAKFTETVELHAQLNLGTGTRGKARKGGGSNVSGRVRGFVTLPHGQLGQLAALHPQDAYAEKTPASGETAEQAAEEDGDAAHADEECREEDEGHVGRAARLGRGDCGERSPETPRKAQDEKANAQAESAPLLGGVINVKPESGVVRGNKRGGIWRRKRVIAAFVDKKDEAAALEAGANMVGAERILEEIRTNKISFEVLISTPDMVARLTRYGKILGPKDLMPQTAWGTLTPDFAGAIRLYRQTTIPYKADRFNIIHMPIGLVSMSNEELRENLDAAIASINARRPPSAGNKFFNKIHISSTMGPGIFIDMHHVKLTAAAAARGTQRR